MSDIARLFSQSVSIQSTEDSRASRSSTAQSDTIRLPEAFWGHPVSSDESLSNKPVKWGKIDTSGLPQQPENEENKTPDNPSDESSPSSPAALPATPDVSSAPPPTAKDSVLSSPAANSYDSQSIKITHLPQTAFNPSIAYDAVEPHRFLEHPHAKYKEGGGEKSVEQRQLVAIQPESGTFLINAPAADIEKAKAILSKNNLELVGIVGSGPKGRAPDHLKDTSPFSNGSDIQAGYSFADFNRLDVKNSTTQKVSMPNPVIENRTLLQQPFLATEGILTRKTENGLIQEAISVAGLSVADRNKQIEQWKADTSVVAFSLDAFPEQSYDIPHDQRRVLQKRKQNPGYEQNYWDDGGKSTAQRMLRVFKTDKTYIGSILTPPIQLKDVRAAAEAAFPGESIGIIQNQDGATGARVEIAGSGGFTESDQARNRVNMTLAVRVKNPANTSTSTIQDKPTASQPDDWWSQKQKWLAYMYEEIRDDVAAFSEEFKQDPKGTIAKVFDRAKSYVGLA